MPGSLAKADLYTYNSNKVGAPAAINLPHVPAACMVRKYQQFT